MSGDASPRYAVYFVPASGTALDTFGCAVLGYDALSGADVPFVNTCGMTDAAWAAATSEPRRYGFHATLKAPFRLKDGVTESELVSNVRRLSRRLQVAGPVRLIVKGLTRFVALVPATSSPDIDRLASDVIGDLDWLRAALTTNERERRLAAGLTERQRAYLEAYGYPYVGDEFRFHMTLVGPLSPSILPIVQQSLAGHFAKTDCNCVVDALSVLRQDGPEERFRVIARCALGLPQGEGVPR